MIHFLRRTHHHFNLLQVQRTERPLIVALFWYKCITRAPRSRPRQQNAGRKGRSPAALGRTAAAAGWSHFLKTQSLFSHQVSVLSEDLRVQLSSVDAMLPPGLRRCGVLCCRTELRGGGGTRASLQAAPASDARLRLLTFSFIVFRFLEEQLRGPSVTTSTG